MGCHTLGSTVLGIGVLCTCHSGCKAPLSLPFTWPETSAGHAVGLTLVLHLNLSPNKVLFLTASALDFLSRCLVLGPVGGGVVLYPFLFDILYF